MRRDKTAHRQRFCCEGCAALAPFAAFARVMLAQMDARDDPKRDADIVMMIDEVPLTVGDLRRAVAADDGTMNEEG